MADTGAPGALSGLTGIGEYRRLSGLMATARIIVAFGSSTQWSLAGEETSIRAQYQALRDALQEVDGVHARFFELTGFRDVGDRNPEQFFVRIEDITAVDLQET